MGDPRKLRKKYDIPSHPWQKQRIEEENALREEYGLKNKREIWRAKAIVGKYRKLARDLVGMPAEERQRGEAELIGKMVQHGFLAEGKTIDDVLSLDTRNVLERRLQTRAWKLGLAKTATQARQFIVHGHIAVNNVRTNAPAMLVTVEQEKTIGWYKGPIQMIPPEAVKVDVMDVKKAEEAAAAAQAEPKAVEETKGEEA